MKTLLLTGFLLLTSVSAHAFTDCATTALSAKGAYLPEEQEDPAVSGDDMYAAYAMLPSNNLVFRASHDGGKTWARSVLDVYGWLPRIVTSGDYVYVAWFSNRSGKWQMMFASSKDGGKTFKKVNLGKTYFTQKPSEDNEAQIAATGSLVSLVYISGPRQMSVATTHDNGKSFNTVQIPTNADPQEEYIAAYKNNIAAVWNGSGKDGLTKNLMSYSDDGGATFSKVKNLTPDELEDVEPQMTVAPEDGTFYMVWREARSSYGLTVGFISKSTDFGKTWSKPALVDPVARHARQFAVAASDQNVYVAYLRDKGAAPGEWWTQLAISRDAGNTFDKPEVLGDTGLSGMLSGETHAPRMWAEKDLFRIVFDLAGSLAVRASTDNAAHLSAAVTLGTGSGALIERNSIFWTSSSDIAMISQCK